MCKNDILRAKIGWRADFEQNNNAARYYRGFYCDSSTIMDLLFRAFLAARVGDFRRIARRTRGEMTAEDLHGEAWLKAMEISRRVGRPIDFSDAADQDQIFAALYVTHVRQADWTQRLALSLDREPDDAENGHSMMERLVASNTADPLLMLEMLETKRVEEAAAERALASSYSQAAACFIVFAHFDGSRKRISAYLFVHRTTLYQRVRRASDTFHAQASLFDRVEIVAASFMPLPGRERQQWAMPAMAATQVEFVY